VSVKSEWRTGALVVDTENRQNGPGYGHRRTVSPAPAPGRRARVGRRPPSRASCGRSRAATRVRGRAEADVAGAGHVRRAVPAA
jgi:hypothetical protein